MNIKKLQCVLIMTGVMLSACGGDGTTDSTGTVGANQNSSASRSLSGAVIKGPVSSSSVCLFSMNGGTPGNQIGNCTTTDSSGNYSLSNISGDGPFLLTATGGTYIDEISGNPVVLSNSQQSFKTIAFPALSTTNIQLTPFTSIIANEVMRVVASTQVITQQDVMNGQVRVRTAFSLPDNLDLLAGSPVFGTNENGYGLALKTISQMIANGRSLASIVAVNDASTLSNDYRSASAMVQNNGSQTGGGGGSGNDTSQQTTPTASGSMTVSSTTTSRPNFIPSGAGFTIKATDSSPSIEFSFNNGSLQSPRAVTFLETVGKETVVSLLEGQTVFECTSECASRKLVPQGARSPISFSLSDTPLRPRNNTITERVTLSGTLTGNVTNAWFTPADIPLTTTGSLQVVRNGITQSLTIPVAVVAQSDNTAARTVTIYLSNGESINASVPATGTPTAAYNSGTLAFCFSDCNITFTRNTETDSIAFNNSNLGGIRVTGTVTVRRATGSLTTNHVTAALQQYTVVSSETIAENDLRTIRFSRPASNSDQLSSLVVEHRNRVVTSVGISGTRGGLSVIYQCNANSQGFQNQPPLCSGITIGDDQRTISFQNTSFRDALASSNSNPTPTMVVNGTISARGR